MWPPEKRVPTQGYPYDFIPGIRVFFERRNLP
jgi:hypothetical protein